MAAVRVLESFGYRVDLLDVGCCGRPAVSLGMLDLAGRQIKRATGAVLSKIDETPATPILFLEPSCLSSALDEWVGLKIPGIDTDARRAIAQRCESVENFVDRAWSAHPCRPDFASTDTQRFVLHEHCHQKALLGAGHGAKTLQRLAPDRVTVLDAGCCGMAGAWGMAKHRFDLSMEIGERILFPSIREAPDGAAVVAPGTSCRHQILDGTSIQALHPVEVIESMISESKE
jgi:Fe-S oxidoreductase